MKRKAYLNIPAIVQDTQETRQVYHLKLKQRKLLDTGMKILPRPK